MRKQISTRGHSMRKQISTRGHSMRKQISTREAAARTSRRTRGHSMRKQTHTRSCSKDKQRHTRSCSKDKQRLSSAVACASCGISKQEHSRIDSRVLVLRLGAGRMQQHGMHLQVKNCPVPEIDRWLLVFVRKQYSSTGRSGLASCCSRMLWLSQAAAWKCCCT